MNKKSGVSVWQTFTISLWEPAIAKPEWASMWTEQETTFQTHMYVINAFIWTEGEEAWC